MSYLCGAEQSPHRTSDGHLRLYSRWTKTRHSCLQGYLRQCLQRHSKPDYEQGSFLTGAQLTGNFAADIYSTLPAGVTYGRLRDLQTSAEFDRLFGGITASPRGTLSLAGYGQYQYDLVVPNSTAGNLAPGTNITLPQNTQVLLGSSGWLGVAQGKLTINLGQGLSFPVALKWSNKTDLLDSRDIRGQIGLSYDLSALSKLVQGDK